MLSVLPLHHTFEFSTGLLVPLARGARITYLQDLTGDAISNVLKAGKITAIVGVPAVWETLRRRVLQKFSDRSATLESLVNALTRPTLNCVRAPGSTSACSSSSPCTRASAAGCAT